jgi:hypothetical protein
MTVQQRQPGAPYNMLMLVAPSQQAVFASA